MKHFTFSLALAFLMTSGFASAQSTRFLLNTKFKTEKSGKSPRFIMKAVSEAGTWKPKKEVWYEPDMEGSEDNWIEVYTTTNEYDKTGNNISAIDNMGEEQERTLSKYDENNNLIEKIKQSLEDGEWVNNEKTEYVYDDIVKDYQTERKVYAWNASNSQWEIYYAHNKEITRNANGYVTQISVKLMEQGNDQFIETERIEITYTNGDLPALSWKHSQADESLQLKEKVRYDKINWDRSDGQILETDESFMIGNNRIKKADVYDEGVKIAIFSCTYVDGKTDFDCLMKSVDDASEIQHKLTETDENGSLKEERIERIDENGDGELTVYEEYQIVTYDDYKNLVSQEFFEMNDGNAEQTDGTKMLYTYGASGEITERIDLDYNFDMEEYENMAKMEASDFVFFASSGINNIQVGKDCVLKVLISGNDVDFTMDGMNQYFVYSATGTLVVNNRVDSNHGELSLNGLPAGLYFIKAVGNNHSETVKFIKK